MDKLVIDCTYQAFGADLLRTYDLDPIYPMVSMTLPIGDQMKRWLLCYWCYYDAGVSSYVSEYPSKAFYKIMRSGLNKWPRGMERRHFRGNAAMEALASLEECGCPEKVVDAMAYHKRFQQVSNAAQSFRGFGPWIGWKIADMAERVLQYPVDFKDSNLGIYRDPRMGAAFIMTGDKHYPINDEELCQVVGQLLDDFSNYKAPPYSDRAINVQEIETILCKFKAHCFGHYPWGNDSYHVYKALDGWGDTAGAMQCNLKKCCTYCEDIHD